MKKIIVNFINQNKGYISLVLFSTLLFSIINISFGVLIKYIVDEASIKDSSIVYYAIFFVLIRLTTPILYGFIDYGSSKISDKLDIELKEKLYFNAIELDNIFHNNKNTGEILGKINAGISSARNITKSIFQSIIPVFLDILFIITVIFLTFNIFYSILVLLVLIIYAIAIISQTNKRVPILRELANTERKTMGFFHDSFINHESYKVFGQKKNEEKRLKVIIDNYKNILNINKSSLFKISLIAASVSALGCIIIFYFVTIDILKGNTTIGNFLMLTVFLFQSFLPINSIGFSFRQIKRGLVDLEAINETFFKENENIREIELSIPDHIKIQLDNLTLPLSETLAIKNLSGQLIIEKKEITILTGASGIGKSSLGKLITGLLNNYEGTIQVNNFELKEVNLNLFRKQTTYCSQDTIFFNDTIRNNLLYVQPDSSEIDLNNALTIVGLKDFTKIIDKNIGERGSKISGGERQRLALARSFLKGSKFIILDEPTTGLDQENKENLINILNILKEKFLILVITHDPIFSQVFLKNSFIIDKNTIKQV
ncbi:ATP-binding cassette domain-containing protein [Acinetobacter baumannii]|uniref:ATP-binding cassette domain-containing protein n=1 Tax=Acinetobacter baumannii TaxID=470 RepID=UPI00234103BB|nr:ABC transporter ATP-binding protein [Acinetobacter baumannii]MDC5251962.1 ABC transporter ATP-binding protein/permease [Acinetobacter baumannii]MDK2101841.1 ABC transporter ATP-binding protein [Acinetobacter baumannii]MDK2148315.1 ABC transporter ATP-binding protein [Acinetobacter baumannii]MDK2177212.1 ABC transporter ATP-binding protein [Acinetobacter baumannii]MDK2195519.1 ABC transporter ATP-binding protein [Acinetobacter baumannii]